AALEILCAEFGERSELDVQAQIDELPLGDPKRLTVYRLVQEALTNVAKYASAKHVRVTVRARDDQAVIEVADDGIGFDPAHASADAHGLAGMRFRVRSAQGELRIRSRRGRGTAILATLPLDAGAAAGTPVSPPTLELADD